MGDLFCQSRYARVRRGRRVRRFCIVFTGVSFGVFTLATALQFRTPSATATIPQPHRPYENGFTTILTLAAPLEAGAALESAEFEEVPWPKGSIGADFVLKRSDLTGTFAKLTIPSGQPIDRNMVTADPIAVTLPVRNGFRAVSVALDAVGSIEGHAKPGSMVDVVVTMTDDGSVTSKIVTEQVRVLSLGGESSSKATRRPGGQHAQTVTLEMTPQAALATRTAAGLGKMSLILRDSSDLRSPFAQEFTQAEIVRAKKTKTESRCTTRGTVKFGGTQYSVGCDQALVRVDLTE